MERTHKGARRRVTMIVSAAAMALVGGALPASAHGTCSDVGFLGIEVHGHHVVRDYVVGAQMDWPPSGGVVGTAVAGRGAYLPGGPGPAYHFENGVAPGASFCTQSRSPGFHVPS